jgi:hypothetical protein
VKKLLIVLCACAAFVPSIASAASDAATKTAIVARTMYACSRTGAMSDKTKADVLYYTDAVTVFSIMDGAPIPEDQKKIAEDNVERKLKELGDEAFCAKFKPILDDLVRITREQYPDLLATGREVLGRR